ncbi:hypothetical protein [Planctomicrobium sp. SH527]|uniref:hypothetical protein n=1 Tax=Planctomicrobium sp. SH527 TaxID=3448123 RepID=UPI003F5C4A2D
MHQARSGVRRELPSGRLHGELALVRLRARKTQIPWAEKSRWFLRKPDAGDPHVRFDEREVETEHGKAIEAPATERAGNG